MNNEKTQGELLKEKLTYKQKNAWEHSEKEIQQAFELCDEYKKYLDEGKTEREFCSVVEKQLVKAGYENLNELMIKGTKLKQGDKVYYINKGKSAIFAVIGQEPLTGGINMVGAHIDSPRLDLKPNPLYEGAGMVLLKTHYYGGIKKYQWVTIPYALHGVVIKADGTKVEISIGEDDKDPVFTITDLLPHLAQEQMQKKATAVIEGESLNILFGSMPLKDDKVKDKIKLNILKLLNEKYGMVEEDFISAELEAVPAYKARDIGLDRSMIGAYGQDDRVCAFTCVKAMLNLVQPEKTALCILTDKEEIGSMGNTGAQSSLLKNFVSKLLYLSTDNYSDILTNQCLENSKMLSADVNAAVDPTYESVNEKSNSSYMGNGIVIQKYTGSRGKYDASDANAEFMAEIRNLFNKEGIIWHSSEMGKVDLGGGGTIAQYVANLGVDVLDCGVPILSMHSPIEISSKIDVYMSYKGMKVFLESK
ncbi:aminopeptidase [Ruminiclostridium josui]|uniref:aminopeptidase n=1 Tax=Ruminiclostridium josui TaxID=1499 RepID=UPI0004663AA5|nr:aminopeptidase [Ruminiclostridium josui]